MFNGTRNDYYGPSRTRETARSQAYRERIGMLEMERINEGILDRLGIRQYMHLFNNSQSTATEASEATVTTTAPQSFIHPESGQLVRTCQYGIPIHVTNTSTSHPPPAPKPSLLASQIDGEHIGQCDQLGECDPPVSKYTKDSLQQVLPYRRITTPSQSTDSCKLQSVCSVDPSVSSFNHLEAYYQTLPSSSSTNKVDNISTISTGGILNTRSRSATTTGLQIVVGTGTVCARSTIKPQALKIIQGSHAQSAKQKRCSGAEYGRADEEPPDGRMLEVKTSSNPWLDPVWISGASAG